MSLQSTTTPYKAYRSIGSQHLQLYPTFFESSRCHPLYLAATIVVVPRLFIRKLADDAASIFLLLRNVLVLHLMSITYWSFGSFALSSIFFIFRINGRVFYKNYFYVKKNNWRFETVFGIRSHEFEFCTRLFFKTQLRS